MNPNDHLAQPIQNQGRVTSTSCSLAFLKPLFTALKTVLLRRKSRKAKGPCLGKMISCWAQNSAVDIKRSWGVGKQLSLESIIIDCVVRQVYANSNWKNMSSYSKMLLPEVF